MAGSTERGRGGGHDGTVMGKLAEHTEEKRKFFFLKSFISHRLVILRARLVLLLVISAVIIITAAVTWSISLKATNNSFDGMSAQLREDVTAGAVKELTNFLNTLSLGVNALYLSLEGTMPNFGFEGMAGPVFPLIWSAFKVYNDTTAVFVISSQGLTSAYRRNGPEGRLLNSTISVGFPVPANNSVDFLIGYVPDPVTGAPNFTGPSGKFCIVERCPKPLDMSIYVGPSVNPLRSPLYLAGKNLPRLSFSWGVTVDNGFQPYMFVVGAIKDKVTGNTSAVVSLTAIATKLRPIVEATSIVQRYHGRMFITLGRQLNMVTSSHGVLFVPPAVVGAPPSFISATNSSDPIIRKASIYLNDTYGERLFTEPFQVITHLPGSGSYYIHTAPIRHETLLLGVFVVAPREDFRGEINDSRQKGLLIAMGIAFALFVVGGLAMCLSTISLSRVLAHQGRKLDKAAAANEALSKQLAALTSDGAVAWPKVDMGTPLEKLTMIIQGLKKGHVLSHAQVMQMQTLIAADDLHKPQFLASIQAGMEQDAQGSHRESKVDSETGSWIEIFATGRRGTADLRRVSNAPTPTKAPLRFRKSISTMSPCASLTKPGQGANEVKRTSSFSQPRRARDADSISEKDSNRDAKGALMNEAADAIAGALMAPAINPNKVAAQRPPDTVVSSAHVMLSESEPAGGTLVRLHRVQAGELDERLLETLLHVTLVAATAPEGPAPSPVPGEDVKLCPPVGVALQGAREPAKLLPPRHSNALHGSALDKAAASEQHQKQVALLRKIGDWDFDTLMLAHVSPDSVVQLVGFSLFTKMGLILEFNINERKLGNFLQQIGRGMQPHPYHNAIHISDVSASLFHLLMESGVGDHLRGIDRLAAVCAALVHDYKHPGVNNDFMNRTKNDLATIYNDHSPLENYHLTEAFHLLYSNQHCNFLGELSEADFMEVRRIVIDLVLASDLKRHFGILDQLRARVSQGTPWDSGKESDRMLLMQLALKVSDIGHAAKPLHVHQEWSRRVTEEWYKQGDAEREANLNVSPFMDRFNNNVPRSQFLALPLFEAWVKAFPRSAHIMSNVSANVAYWKQELHGSGQ
eukprot:jgi/Mesvir1/11303/Mv01089-RA.2